MLGIFPIHLSFLFPLCFGRIRDAMPNTVYRFIGRLSRIEGSISDFPFPANPTRCLLLPETQCSEQTSHLLANIHTAVEEDPGLI